MKKANIPPLNVIRLPTSYLDFKMKNMDYPMVADNVTNTLWDAVQ